MKQKILLVFIAFIACVFPIYSQIASVAGWSIIALGDNRNHLSKIYGEAMATLIIHDNTLVFALWDTESQKSLGPAFILENLYLEQSAAEGDSFIGMQSKVRTDNNVNKTGTLYLSVSKSDAGRDVIHFDFGDKALYIIGELIEEDMVVKLGKLGAIGSAIKYKAKLKVSLAEAFEIVTNEHQ